MTEILIAILLGLILAAGITYVQNRLTASGGSNSSYGAGVSFMLWAGTEIVLIAAVVAWGISTVVIGSPIGLAIFGSYLAARLVYLSKKKPF